MWDRLSPKGLSEYKDHLLKLDQDDRILRFSSRLSDESIKAYVENIPLTDDVLVYKDLSGEGIIAACHLAFIDSTHVEIGLSVLRDYRGGGLGTRLLERAITIARMRLAKRVTMVCLSNNSWVVKKVRELGMDMSSEDGQCQADGYYSLLSPIEYPTMAQQYCYELCQMCGKLTYTLKGIATTITNKLINK